MRRISSPYGGGLRRNGLYVLRLSQVFFLCSFCMNAESGMADYYAEVHINAYKNYIILHRVQTAQL